MMEQVKNKTDKKKNVNLEIVFLDCSGLTDNWLI